MSLNEPTAHPPNQPASQPIHKLAIPETGQLFKAASQSLSNTGNMLHFHLMRRVEVKYRQSQRHEISHLTITHSISDTHYFVLLLESCFVLSHFSFRRLFCSFSVYVYPSTFWFSLCLTPRDDPVLHNTGLVQSLSPSITASKVNWDLSLCVSISG